ncbi:unnamed protein product, partial [Eruca vesicaria subsp. sativa]|nr:unnamed protein product [Eruca vesicaria subsp. sativa]
MDLCLLSDIKLGSRFWLFEQKDLRIEGMITGFDEYMNLVLNEADEVSIKKNTRKQLGEFILDSLFDDRAKLVQI